MPHPLFGDFAKCAALRIAGVLLGLGTAIFLARALGPSGYGIYAFALVLASALAQVLLFGLPTLVMRETAYARADGDWPRLRRLWKWSGRATVGTVLGAGATVGFGLWALGDAITPTRAATLGVGLLFMLFVSFQTLWGASLHGLGRVVANQFLELCLRPAVFLALLLFLTVVASGTPSPPLAMGLYAAAAAAAFATGAWLLHRAAPPGVRIGKAPGGAAPGWQAARLAMGLVVLMNLINAYADIVVLGVFRPDNEVGFFRAAWQVSTLASFGMDVVVFVIMPHFARMHRDGDWAGLQRMATLGARLAVAMALPVVAVCAFLGAKVLVLIFGVAYAPGFAPMLILAAGQLANAYFGLNVALISMTGLEGRAAKAMTAAAATNLVLNLGLVPTFGMHGAAFATTATLTMLNVLLWRTARRELGIDTRALLHKVWKS